MWLIDTGNLVLREFVDAPPYAILSHRWHDEKVTFREMQRIGREEDESQCGAQLENRRQRLTQLGGGTKIVGACSQARHDGFDWIWIDTCCIDKTSSAELSEAINSMYRWYKESKICYAFIEHSPWTESDWFERGWTLQELLAPGTLQFFDNAWDPFGTRFTLAAFISERTGIDTGLLCATAPSSMLKSYSVAQRMALAANRKTTRLEDRAYSLLGIFDVNMPLLYGEGEGAFIRLQEQIIQNSDDQSILAWDRSGKVGGTALETLLAPRPDYFAGLTNIIAVRDATLPRASFSLSNLGLNITLPYFSGSKIVILTCGELGTTGLMGIRLKQHPVITNAFICHADPYHILRMSARSYSTQEEMVLVRRYVPGEVDVVDLRQSSLLAWFMHADPDPQDQQNTTLHVMSTARLPRSAWDQEMGMFRLSTWSMQSAGGVFYHEALRSHGWFDTFQSYAVCFAIYQPIQVGTWDVLHESLIRNSAVSIVTGGMEKIEISIQNLFQELSARTPESYPLQQSARKKLSGFPPRPMMTVNLQWKLIAGAPALELIVGVTGPRLKKLLVA